MSAKGDQTMKRHCYATSLSLTTLLLLLLFTSCSSTFYYSTLATANYDVAQVENGDFLIDEPNLWIAYNFNGENAPVKITVFNKTDKPMYIDWAKSAMSINNEAVSYGNNYTSSTMTYFDDFGQPTAITSLESAYLNGNRSFIPPQSMITHTPISLLGLSFEDVPKQRFTKERMMNKNNQGYNVEKIVFDEPTSPLKLKSYLTIYEDKNNRPLIFEQEFFLQQITKTKNISPSKLPKEVAERGDLFYLEKIPNTTGIEILVGTGIVVGTVATSVAIDLHRAQ